MTETLSPAASDRLVRDSNAGMERLIEIMRRLRDPETGCPWDIEQTFETIAPYTIEEAYEVADAIERKAYGELKKELGDLLLQAVYHAAIADEAELFSFQDVVSAISDKMVDRHPHVFGDESRDKSAEQQTRDWEAMKAKERGDARVLDGVAGNLPALLRAIKLQNRAARVGFDWPQTEQVLDKLVEEAGELIEAKGDHEKVTEEFGDLAFVMANLARHLGVDPEEALRRTNAKFTRRFNAVEDALRAEGRHPSEATLAEMDALWDAAKLAERAT